MNKESLARFPDLGYGWFPVVLAGQAYFHLALSLLRRANLCLRSGW